MMNMGSAFLCAGTAGLSGGALAGKPKGLNAFYMAILLRIRAKP
jgi:hypothetical protein